MHYILEAKYLEQYKLLLTFEDQQKMVVDLENHLEGAIFRPLKNIEYFKKVKVDHELDTIVWDNGADMSPDFLYKIGTPSL